MLSYLLVTGWIQQSHLILAMGNTASKKLSGQGLCDYFKFVNWKWTKIYRNGAGRPRMDIMLGKKTVWLSPNQLADLFGCDVKTIGCHVNNVFFKGESEKLPVVANITTTDTDT